MEVHAADTTSFVSRFATVAGIVDSDDAAGCLIATNSLDTAELLIRCGWMTVANSRLSWGGPANDGNRPYRTSSTQYIPSHIHS